MKILDKYILKQVIMTMLFSIAALCVIFIVVNLLENLDEFIDQKTSDIVIIKYYLFSLPEIIKILTPVAMLVSTLFTIGKLSTNNEITAMKTGSYSLYRLLLPLGIFALLISFGQLYFNGWIVPKANQEKISIEHKYLRKWTDNSPMNNIYFRDTPNRTVTIQYYDADLKIGNAVAIEDYTSDTHPRLLQRIEARQMIWDSVVRDWRLKTAIERKFDGFRVNSVVVNEMPIQLNITNAKILELKKQPDEMTYDELWRYLMLLQQGGKNIRRQLIEYYGNFAFPFANLIVILFGVPFASVRRKGGLAIQIGAAMTISFLYLVFTKISQTIGFSMDLNPILVGWMANIVFIMLALFVLNKSRT